MKTILVIDPSESDRLLLQEELGEEGYRGITAHDQREVLSGEQKFKPDLIILDFRQKNPQAEMLGALKRPLSSDSLGWIFHLWPMPGGI